MGSIPDTVCYIADKNITIFDFSISGSNAMCAENRRIQSYRPPLVHGTFSRLGLSGTIPSCLLTSTSMTALRLSDNRLQGSLASSVLSSIRFMNLTLAYNSLTGSIPGWIQQHSFQELDLSNNRLDGTLSSDFMVSAYQTTLGLAVNRLSGELPNSITEIISNLRSLNVLAGNIFACNNNDLPAQDPSADSYSCGSYELDVSSYTCLIFVGTCTLIGIIVRMVAYRYDDIVSRFRFYQQLLAWSADISQLFDKDKSSNKISQTWITRFQLLPETMTFLVLIHCASRAIFYISLTLICIALPTYIGLHPASSIVTYDYGHIISIAYLHGIQPVIFIGVLQLVLFVNAIYFVRSFLAVLDNIRGSYGGKEASITSSSWNTNPSVWNSYAWKHYLIFLALNLINLVVVMTVNIAYVNILINSTSCDRVDLLFIQAALGLFKVVWNGVYVSWSCDWLTTFSSHRRSMRSRFIMSIINYIVAPVVSTIVYSESCFYFVFNSAEKVSSSFSLSLEELGYCGSYTCVLSFPINIDSTSVSSFDYSYACGQALIVAYTPVLILSYLFSGLFRPGLHIMALDNPISRFIYYFLNYPLIDLCAYRPKIRVGGRDIVVRLMVHSTVLFTFGLAAPILVIPIVFSVIIDCSIYQLLVGKALYENDKEITPDPTHPTALNPIAPYDMSIGTSPDKRNDSRHGDTQMTILADLLTMEHLDMASSYEAIDACFHLMIIFVMQFWALLFFDLIADIYGVINGIFTMTCFALLPALLLIVLDKSNLILRLISLIGLGHGIDHYLANTIGVEMSLLQVTNRELATRPDSSSASIGSVSVSIQDVEMTTQAQNNHEAQITADDRKDRIQDLY
jgi:hypothetical protein